MKKPVYAVRDARVGFMTPIVDDNDASAMRGFENAVISGEGYFANFASEYDLFRIGVFDTEQGQFVNEMPDLLCSGASVLLAKRCRAVDDEVISNEER